MIGGKRIYTAALHVTVIRLAKVTEGCTGNDRHITGLSVLEQNSVHSFDAARKWPILSVLKYKLLHEAPNQVHCAM